MTNEPHVPKPGDAYDDEASEYRHAHVLLNKVSSMPACGCTVDGYGTLPHPVKIVFCPAHAAKVPETRMAFIAKVRGDERRRVLQEAWNWCVHKANAVRQSRALGRRINVLDEVVEHFRQQADLGDVATEKATVRLMVCEGELVALAGQVRRYLNKLSRSTHGDGEGRQLRVEIDETIEKVMAVYADEKNGYFT